MFKVIKRFVDLQDDNHVYDVGDRFPRRGIRVSPERLQELLSSDNRRGIPLIKEEPSNSGNGRGKKGKNNARTDS